MKILSRFYNSPFGGFRGLLSKSLHFTAPLSQHLFQCNHFPTPLHRAWLPSHVRQKTLQSLRFRPVPLRGHTASPCEPASLHIEACRFTHSAFIACLATLLCQRTSRLNRSAVFHPNAQKTTPARLVAERSRSQPLPSWFAPLRFICRPCCPLCLPSPLLTMSLSKGMLSSAALHIIICARRLAHCRTLMVFASVPLRHFVKVFRRAVPWALRAISRHGGMCAGSLRYVWCGFRSLYTRQPSEVEAPACFQLSQALPCGFHIHSSQLRRAVTRLLLCFYPF